MTYKKMSFAEVMNEAKEIWISTLDKGKTDEEKENYLNTMQVSKKSW